MNLTSFPRSSPIFYLILFISNCTISAPFQPLIRLSSFSMENSHNALSTPSTFTASIRTWNVWNLSYFFLSSSPFTSHYLQQIRSNTRPLPLQFLKPQIKVTLTPLPVPPPQSPSNSSISLASCISSWPISFSETLVLESGFLHETPSSLCHLWLVPLKADSSCLLLPAPYLMSTNPYLPLLPSDAFFATISVIIMRTAPTINALTAWRWPQDILHICVCRPGAPFASVGAIPIGSAHNDVVEIVINQATFLMTVHL